MTVPVAVAAQWPTILVAAARVNIDRHAYTPVEVEAIRSLAALPAVLIAEDYPGPVDDELLVWLTEAMMRTLADEPRLVELLGAHEKDAAQREEVMP